MSVIEKNVSQEFRFWIWGSKLQRHLLLDRLTSFLKKPLKVDKTHLKFKEERLLITNLRNCGAVKKDLLFYVPS